LRKSSVRADGDRCGDVFGGIMPAARGSGKKNPGRAPAELQALGGRLDLALDRLADALDAILARSRPAI
jgi:hypothetical protein